MAVEPVKIDDYLDTLSETFTNDTVLTPPSSTWGDRPLQASRTLQAGHTYVIRSLSCGRQITLLNGAVVLSQPGSLGSAHWTCVEVGGWLGFRNVASGNFLRHGGDHHSLGCSNPCHKLWERIQIRPHDALHLGFTLLMEYWGGLKPVGTKMKDGAEKLDRLYEPGAQGLAWIFLEVS